MCVLNDVSIILRMPQSLIYEVVIVSLMQKCRQYSVVMGRDAHDKRFKRAGSVGEAAKAKGGSELCYLVT